MRREHFKLVLERAGLILFGLAISLVLIEVAMRISGAFLLHLQEAQNEITGGESDVVVILCLGESTTARGGPDSWPAQLNQILNASSTGIAFNTVNKGVEGIQSHTLAKDLAANLDRYEPDIVITMLGVNDAGDTVRFDDSLESEVAVTLRELRIYKLAKFFYLAFSEGSSSASPAEPGPVAAPEPAGETPSSPAAEPEEAKTPEQEAEEARQWDRFWELYRRAREDAQRQGRLGEAEALLKEAIEIKPDVPYGHQALGLVYSQRWEETPAWKPERRVYFASAVEQFERALQIDPKDEPTYSELGMLYRKAGEIDRVYELAQRILAAGLESDRMKAFVGAAYRDQGMQEEAQRYFDEAELWRATFYKRATAHNYNRIADEVLERGGRLIAMQYPVRRVEPLQRLLRWRHEILFVSNEENFVAALRRQPFSALFTDNFGGDFGHATRAGNRLIAENLAEAVAELVGERD